MPKDVWAYRLTELPDPAYPSYRLMAGGDVRAALRADGEHLLRTLADFPANSVSVAIRFAFSPAAQRSDPQTRLSVTILGRAYTREAALALSVLLQRGPFQRFCRLAPVDADATEWGSFDAACDVVRRQTVLEPTVTAESNPRALDAYLTVDGFQPNPSNDYLLLDSLLDRVAEPALIEVCLGPASIREELSLHTKYLAKVQMVNRTWDADPDEPPRRGFDTGGDWSLALKPLLTKDPLADDVARRQRRFHETLTKPHLAFHFRVLTRTAAVARLVASVAADSAFKDGSYQLFDSKKGEPFFEEAIKGQEELRVTTMPALDRLLDGRCAGLLNGLSNLANVAPVDQLASAFRLPVASHGSPRCIRKNTDPRHERGQDLIIVGSDEHLDSDSSKAPPSGVARGIPVKGLPKHLFVSGMPGSGKTTSIMHLMFQLSKRGIPFIVFEPAKSEYRLLKCVKANKRRDVNRLVKELQVYTPGNELISPFRLNPLRITPGTSRDAHIENVLNCFRAAVPMFDPLPAIFGEALERVYKENPDSDVPPSMAELNSMARRVLAAKRYAGEVDSNLKAALDVRLGMLSQRAIGNVFKCRKDSPTIDQLMQGSSIIELGSVPPEQACLLTLFALTAIRERLDTPWHGRDVRLVIVLEEAHNVVGSTFNRPQSEDHADPKAYAAEFICRMLAELRALGVAIVIVDQLPSAIAPEVLKNTASKLAFRQVANQDREDLGGTMLFGQLETEEIARLRPGEAYFFTEGYFGSRRIRTPDLHKDLGLPSPPVGNAILPHLVDSDWFIEAAERRIRSALEQLTDEMDKFDQVSAPIFEQVETVRREHVRILKDLPKAQRASPLTDLAGRARALRKELASAFWVLERRAFTPLSQVDPHLGIVSEILRCWHRQTIDRFESITKPGTRACLTRFDDLIRKCSNDTYRHRGV